MSIRLGQLTVDAVVIPEPGSDSVVVLPPTHRDVVVLSPDVAPVVLPTVATSDRVFIASTTGPKGDPGPQGPVGEPGPGSVRRFYGDGPPPVTIPNAIPGDEYVDLVSGDLFRLS